MVVMAASAEFRLWQSRSLKEKRQLTQSALRRLPRLIPVQVAEVDAHDDYGRVVFGLVAVGVDRVALERRLWQAIRWLEQSIGSDAFNTIVAER